MLLVEDEGGVRRVAQRILARRGFRVVEARDGNEALARIAEHQVDIVLTDVVMPGLSGRELVSRLRRLRPRLPVLIMTGYSDRLDIWEDGTPVLAKPFTEETLLAELDEARAAHAMPRARA